MYTDELKSSIAKNIDKTMFTHVQEWIEITYVNLPVFWPPLHHPLSYIYSPVD